MRKISILLTLLLLLGGSTLLAQRPRLLVVVTVDELRSDLLEEFLPQLPNRGFSDLIAGGLFYPNIYHPLLSADATASQAIIHTGTLALANGVPSRTPIRISQQGRRTYGVSVFEDNNYLGRGTSERRSPLALAAPTLADQLKQATSGNAIVYSLAPSAEEAIVAGGQYANGAFWIDDFLGKWTSTTYYTEGLPWYVEKNTFDRGKTLDMKLYKHTPKVNEEVLHIAKTLLDNTALGKDSTTDLLILHLYAGHKPDGTMPTLDSYAHIYQQLDQVLAQLIAVLDSKIGTQNYAIALTGNGIAKSYASLPSKHHLFQPERAKALLNMYLIAKYGQNNWVEEITTEGEIFLNRSAIKENSTITLETMQNEVTDFMLEFSGVQSAVANYRLRQESVGRERDRVWQTLLNKATHKNRSDVLFELLPAWGIEDLSRPEWQTPFRRRATTTAFIFYAPSNKPQVEYNATDLRTVSQIISHKLRIQPPSHLIQ